jgi:GT2 family glycosyltransferase
LGNIPILEASFKPPENAMSSARERDKFYANLVRDSAWLERAPFEHTFRSVPHVVFLQRLVRERHLTEGWKHLSFNLTIVIVANDDLDGFSRTVESCFLQTAAKFHILILTEDYSTRSALAALVSDRWRQTPELEKHFEGRIQYGASVTDALREDNGAQQYIACVRNGDVFHPSFATSLYLELINSSPAAAVYIWNEMHVSFDSLPQVRKFVRKPLLETYTLFHFNYIGTSFAVHKSFLLSFHYQPFKDDKIHYFLLNVLSEKGQFKTIPEYLLLRDACNDPWPLYAADLPSQYEQYFGALGFRLVLIESSRSYQLIPERSAKSISVIIPFRDKPRLTCKAIESVLKQDIAVTIEIILVNNQSSPESLGFITDYIKKIQSSRASFRIVDYDEPFNHSAECNLGARQAHGECLLFMNNDVQLLSPDALKYMSAWSLLPDTGTIGVRLIKDGRLISAGIQARLSVGMDYNSLVEECTETEFAGYNRETWGNTFACAVISKQKFRQVGELDGLNFPNGYNDVDYSVRCKKAGLANIYLGTLTAFHSSGASRGRCDELYQKILVRRKHPEIVRDGLYQLTLEKRLLPADHSSPHVDPFSGYFKSMSKTLRNLTGM